jgi:hypothetical protein
MAAARAVWVKFSVFLKYLIVYWVVRRYTAARRSSRPGGLAGDFRPGAAGWDALPCGILNQALWANCAQNRDADLPPGWPGLLALGLRQPDQPANVPEG